MRSGHPLPPNPPRVTTPQTWGGHHNPLARHPEAPKRSVAVRTRRDQWTALRLAVWTGLVTRSGPLRRAHTCYACSATTIRAYYWTGPGVQTEISNSSAARSPTITPRLPPRIPNTPTPRPPQTQATAHSRTLNAITYEPAGHTNPHRCQRTVVRWGSVDDDGLVLADTDRHSLGGVSGGGPGDHARPVHLPIHTRAQVERLSRLIT